MISAVTPSAVACGHAHMLLRRDAIYCDSSSLSSRAALHTTGKLRPTERKAEMHKSVLRHRTI